MTHQNERDCEHGQLRRSCSICEYEKEIYELKCLLKLTEYNLMYILENNKNILMPPTLKFKKAT